MYRITYIGKDRLETQTLPEEKAIEFFDHLGIEFWEALRGMSPAFVVTKLDETKAKEAAVVAR